MSIATRTGDQGTTGLMYNRRVSKTHPQVEAYGSVDELNAALGVARALAAHVFVHDALFGVQKELVILMGELATDPQDLERYEKDGFKRVTREMTGQLDRLVKEIEAQKVSFSGWATPGASPLSAALDMARTTCRRAERRLWSLESQGLLTNSETTVYLNRLSDVLWLMARWVETRQELD